MNTFQIMPDLSETEFAALKSDIADRGVMVPIEYDDDGNVIDGHHRIRACNELGIKQWPRVVRTYEDELAKRTQARRLNIARRHLDTAAKRALIEAELRDRPEVSNRTIAGDLGVSHHTVGAVREEAEAIGQIAQSDRVERKGGGTYPARKPTVSSFDFGEKNVRGTQGTGENEWYTPASYIELARTVLGKIDVDPASSDAAQRVVKAGQFFSLENDGLGQQWRGTVWLNPPYAQPFIAQFADKMVFEVDGGRVSAAIMLTHNYTDTTWFQKLARSASAICFTRGRIRFESPDGEIAAPTQGQAFFYFGKEIEKFASAFAETGFVVLHV